VRKKGCQVVIVAIRSLLGLSLRGWSQLGCEVGLTFPVRTCMKDDSFPSFLARGQSDVIRHRAVRAEAHRTSSFSFFPIRGSALPSVGSYFFEAVSPFALTAHLSFRFRWASSTGRVPLSHCPTDGKAGPRMSFSVSQAGLLRPTSSLGRVRGPLLGDCRRLGMIRGAETCPTAKPFAPGKTEFDEPDEFTPSRFTAGSVVLVFWFVTVFSFGPLAGFRGRLSRVQPREHKHPRISYLMRNLEQETREKTERR